MIFKIKKYFNEKIILIKYSFKLNLKIPVGLSEQGASYHRNFMYMEKRLGRMEVWRRGKKASQRTDYEPAIDFMMNLDEDVPKSIRCFFCILIKFIHIKRK